MAAGGSCAQAEGGHTPLQVPLSQNLTRLTGHSPTPGRRGWSCRQVSRFGKPAKVYALPPTSHTTSKAGLRWHTIWRDRPRGTKPGPGTHATALRHQGPRAMEAAPEPHSRRRATTGPSTRRRDERPVGGGLLQGW